MANLRLSSLRHSLRSSTFPNNCLSYTHQRKSTQIHHCRNNQLRCFSSNVGATSASLLSKKADGNRHDSSSPLKYSTPILLAAAATSSIIFSEVHSKKISKLEESAPTTTQQAQDEILDNSDDLPVYSLADVAFNNGSNGRPIWVSYAGNVYDITKFIANHPGGSDIIVRASGQALEPYWNLYRQHFSSDLPMKILEPLQIGTLNLNEQEKIDEMMEKEYDENNPYRNEPIRHSALKVHTEEPMNAEVPKDLITSSYITPTELHYIRHHHPVPHVTDPKTYNLEIDLSALGRPTVSLTLEDLKSLPKHEVTVTLQCSGNRRGDFNKEVKKTSGTSWDQGAISTAKWAGPKLRDSKLLIFTYFLKKKSFRFIVIETEV